MKPNYEMMFHWNTVKLGMFIDMKGNMSIQDIGDMLTATAVMLGIYSRCWFPIAQVYKD